MRSIYHVFSIITVISVSYASHAKVLNLSNLESIVKDSPSWASVNSLADSQKLEAIGKQLPYEAQVFVSASKSDSKEVGIASFIPVFDETKAMSIGVRKQFTFGVGAELALDNEAFTEPGASINDSNRTGGRLSLNVDLLSNFLGRIDRSVFKQAELSENIADHYQTLNQNKLIQDVLKMYWGLVTTRESKQLAQSLLKTAEVQARDIARQKKQGAADAGDLAQARSLLATRRNQLKLLKYQEGEYTKSIKMLMPEVSQIANPTSEKDIETFAVCVQKIAQIKTPPKSTLTEIIEKLKKQKGYAVREAKASGDIDLQLVGEFRSNSVQDGLSDSYESFQDDPKDAYQVGIVLTAPIGGDKRRFERSKVNLAENYYRSEIKSLEQEIIETHVATKNNALLLLQAAEDQAESTRNLKLSLRSAKRKFKQARISLRDYITEQNQFFSSQLSELELRQRVIESILDYKKVFNKFECSNSIKVGAI